MVQTLEECKDNAQSRICFLTFSRLLLPYIVTAESLSTRAGYFTTIVFLKWEEHYVERIGVYYRNKEC